MTLNFFPTLRSEQAHKPRYYVSQFDEDTYHVVDSVEKREVCVCSNYDSFLDAAERAEKIAKMLNDKEDGFQKI